MASQHLANTARARRRKAATYVSFEAMHKIEVVAMGTCCTMMVSVAAVLDARSKRSWPTTSSAAVLDSWPQHNICSVLFDERRHSCNNCKEDLYPSHDTGTCVICI